MLGSVSNRQAKSFYLSMPVVKEVEITTVKERGCCGMCGNIIWLIFGGLELALVWLIIGFVLCVTIVGFPMGLQQS